MTATDIVHYTPSPTTAIVSVVMTEDGSKKIIGVARPRNADEAHCWADYCGGNGWAILPDEVARVVARGNLTKDGLSRWHGVILSDGTTGSVLFQGS
jgi:hypothetical protein